MQLGRYLITGVDPSPIPYGSIDEESLVSLKLKKSVDAEGGRTLAVIIEGG